MKIQVKCDYCGELLNRYPSQVKSYNFCNRNCQGAYSSKVHNAEGYKGYRDFSRNSSRMTEMNALLNPTRMTESTKEKIRNAHYRKGERTKYIKFHGRHEHRVVAEKKIGRPLELGEVVHHIDGDKWNNSPENLAVLPSQAEHARLHAEKEVIL